MKKGCGVPRQMLYTAINYKTPWPIKASKHFEHKREEIRIKKELTEDQEKYRIEKIKGAGKTEEKKLCL